MSFSSFFARGVRNSVLTENDLGRQKSYEASFYNLVECEGRHFLGGFKIFFQAPRVTRQKRNHLFLLFKQVIAVFLL